MDSNLSNLNDNDDTLREFANSIGYSSPSSLSMISSGERLPSKTLLEALLKYWKVPHQEKEIVKLKVEIEKKIKNNQDHLELIEDLAKIQKKFGYTEIPLEQFKMVSQWYMLVLRSLLGTPIINKDPNEISVILRRKVSPAKIKTGIDILTKLGFIKKNPETGALEQSQTNIESTHNIPSEAIKNHHTQMIHRALESIEEQTVNERTLNSLTLNFEIGRYKEAQEKILEFVKTFNADFGQNNSEHIYQLNLQFFQHTYGKKIMREFDETKDD